jgi:hypothetical protein
MQDTYVDVLSSDDISRIAQLMLEIGQTCFGDIPNIQVINSIPITKFNMH